MEINYRGVLCRLGTYRINGEEWLAPANTIITIDQTIECLTEFYENQKDKPKSIKWQKLI